MTSILYLITGTSVGGTERTLCEICRRLDRGRYSPTVVSLKTEGPVADQIRALGVEVISLGMRESADWLSAAEFLYGLWRLPRILRPRTFDILHSFLFRANLFGRLVAPRCGIARTVASFRGSMEEPKGWMKALDRRTAGRTDLFCAQSEVLARDLREQLAIPEEKIAVIPNGIDVKDADRGLSLGRTEARRRLGLSPADLVVASLGRLSREKGFHHLLDAFQPFAIDHPRGVLLIAGEGPEREPLAIQAEQLRIAGQVQFTGRVDNPWEVLAAADIFVLSSLYEGMPNALMEAMAASLPVVATAVGAVPEMVTPEKEGILVSPGDPEELFAALNRLAWAADLRRTMGARGRRRVEEKFPFEAVTEALAELYGHLAGS